MRKSVFAICEKKSADQLISAFVAHCLNSIISIPAISKISRRCLVSVAEQAGLSYLVANPEDRFSRAEARLIMVNNVWKINHALFEHKLQVHV